MTKVIANFLQRKSRSQQVTSTGMPQAVRSMRWDLYAEGRQARPHNRTNAVWPDRANRCSERQKQFAMGTSWPYFLQIAQDSVSNNRNQRVLLKTALFWPRYMQYFAYPVHIG